MNNFRKNRIHIGFTLIEVLIVVAVIAVLAAIAIPVYANVMNNVKKSTCASNCRAYYSVLVCAYLIDEKDGFDAAVADNTGNIVCPSGGTISATCSSDGVITVTCSEHGITGAETIMSQTAIDAFKTLLGTTFTDIDSGAPDVRENGVPTHKKELMDKLKGVGIDLAELGAVSWKVVSDSKNSYLIWTTQDISKMNAGDTVTVIKYNITHTEEPKYDGLYSVWTSSVVKSSAGDYMVLVKGNNEVAASKKATLTQKKDISFALDILNDIYPGD